VKHRQTIASRSFRSQGFTPPTTARLVRLARIAYGRVEPDGSDQRRATMVTVVPFGPERRAGGRVASTEPRATLDPLARTTRTRQPARPASSRARATLLPRSAGTRHRAGV